MTRDIWEDVLDQVRMLGRLMRQLGHRRQQAYEGVPPALVLILAALVRGGPMRLTTLAERQSVDCSVASRQVADLIGRGLAERATDPHDGRAHLLTATSEGSALIQRVRQRQAEMIAHALAGWDETDVRTLAALLARLNDELGHELSDATGHYLAVTAR